MFFTDSTIPAQIGYTKLLAGLNSKSFSQQFHENPAHLQHDAVNKLIQKDAVSAITGPALIPSKPSISFLETQRSSGFFISAYSDFWKVPFRINAVGASAIGTGSVVESGLPIPVKKFDLSGHELIEKKASSITVVSKDLIKDGGTDAVNSLNILLADSLNQAIDVNVITDILEHDGTESFSSSGTTSQNFLDDFRLMFDHVNVKGCGRMFWVLSRHAANRLNYETVSLNSPFAGELLGITAVISDALEDDSSGGKILLIDVSKIAANMQGVTIENAEHASIQMDDNPTADPNNVTSFFQQGLLGLKAELLFGFECMSGFRAAVLEGVN